MVESQDPMEPIRTIREATIKDSVGLKNCMESAYAGYQERMGGIRLPPMEVDYSSEINNYPIWVVEAEGSILGGLIMVFENDQASIANIAVHPDYQGKGLGRVLMEYGEGEALKQGYSELRLATHVALTENLSLYNHLGWSEIDRDESRVYMRKVIK